jgi:hypothetical protein
MAGRGPQPAEGPAHTIKERGNELDSGRRAVESVQGAPNVAGKRDQLVGKLQEHYGVLKEDAEKQLDEWIAKLTPDHDKPKA